MTARASITFIRSQEPISGLVTKFGGQPVWLEQPQWPTSRYTGKPMMFVCQIALEAALFPGAKGKMAYFFINNEDGAEISFDPDGGENGVVVQPGNTLIPVLSCQTGPTLFERVKHPGIDWPVHEPREFAVSLSFSDDVPFQSEDERESWSDEQRKAYHDRLIGNKIGGTPWFMQNDEFPKGDGWRLLLQLDSEGIPFWINFGDIGIGYAFLNSEGTAGKFLWQCM